MNKSKYLVLSDRKENKRYVTFRRAKQDHDKRLLSGKDDGIQLWREHKTYDHLILTNNGRNVKRENIKSYHKGIDLEKILI